MKIGILGGTLNPIHNGHIEIARAAMGELGLDRVMLLPSGDPPYKRVRTDKRDRLAMARLAAETYANMFASDLEVRREGTTYTVDTLSALAVEQPEVEWTYILGADALNKLDTWREFPRIARLCAFAAVSRPGCDEELAKLRATAISTCYHTRVDLMPVSGPALSSTAVRRRVAEGLSIDDCVPPAALGGDLRHAKPVLLVGGSGLVGRVPGRHQRHPVQPQLGHRRQRDLDMAVVNGIQRAPQDADFHGRASKF